MNSISRQPPVARLFSLAFGRAYVTTMRPYLLFLSGITGLVGLSLAPSTALAPTLLLGLVFFLSYGFGQALTDCFQMDTDSLSSPYRPLVRGVVARRHVMTVSLAGLVISGLVLVQYHRLNLPLAALTVAGLATYTWFKRRWWGGPFYNSWIVAALMFIGCVSGFGAAGVPLRAGTELVPVAAAVFFGYANFVLAGYFKDLSADRATGYRTHPVVFGFRASTRISDVFAGLTLISTAGAVLMGLSRNASGFPAGLLFSLVGAAVLVTAQVRLHRVREESQAHSAVSLIIHAYMLLLSGIAASMKPGWSPALMFFYAAFAAVLRARPERRQI